MDERTVIEIISKVLVIAEEKWKLFEQLYGDYQDSPKKPSTYEWHELKNLTDEIEMLVKLIGEIDTERYLNPEILHPEIETLLGRLITLDLNGEDERIKYLDTMLKMI